VVIAHTPERNTFELEYQDIIWIEANKDVKPLTFIRGILKRRFDNYSARFRTPRSLAKACFDIYRSCPSYFAKMQVDEELIERLHSSKKSDSILVAFRDLCRGYTDDEIIITQKDLDKDEQRYLKLLDFMVKINQTQVNILGRKRKEITKERLKDNISSLEEIRKMIKMIYRNPSGAARTKLYFNALNRRVPSTISLLFAPNDYLGFEYKINARDPKRLMFPLRFLTHIPAKTYDTFELKWLKGANRDQLILSLVDSDSDDRSFFNDLRILSSELGSKININRLNQVEELEKTYFGNCFTSTALLAVTLTEGIIWDFAAYLNKKRLKIYCKKSDKYYPYEWDHKQKKYKRIKDKTPIANKEYKLTSARSLLQKTRLGSIIPESLYSFLIEEFYDDRNELMHGNFAKRNMKVDAIGALLCLSTSIHYINSNSRGKIY
jgi:hypothetical protein